MHVGTIEQARLTNSVIMTENTQAVVGDGIPP